MHGIELDRTAGEHTTAILTAVIRLNNTEVGFHYRFEEGAKEQERRRLDQKSPNLQIVLVVVVVFAGANHIPLAANEFPLISRKRTKIQREDIISRRGGRFGKRGREEK